MEEQEHWEQMPKLSSFIPARGFELCVHICLNVITYSEIVTVSLENCLS